jgi:hypothetical protein
MKEFNLEEAKEGKPVCTRDGRNARIVCFDLKGTYPIMALLESISSEGNIVENPAVYYSDGSFYFQAKFTSDLMMKD